MVIADVSGRNANVFCELGMAHVLKDRVVLITQDIDDVPFDLRHFRHVTYEQTMEGAAALRQRLLETLTAIGLNRGQVTEDSARLQAAPAKASEPEPLSTTIVFTGDFKDVKEAMFALLTRWVDFEKVEDRYNSLVFPGGTFGGRSGGGSTLTVQPESVPLGDMLRVFGEPYRAIRFVLDKQFDIGDLIRRSRDGSRNVKRVAKDHVVFDVGEDLELVVTNTSDGSQLEVSITSHYLSSWFKPAKPPVSLSVVLSYLEKQPPSKDLADAIAGATG